MRQIFCLVLSFFFLSACLTYKDIEAEKRAQKKKKLELVKKARVEKASSAKKTSSSPPLSDDEKKSSPSLNWTIKRKSTTEKVTLIEEGLRELRGEMEKRNKEREEQSAKIEQNLLTLIQDLDTRLNVLTEEIKGNKTEVSEAKKSSSSAQSLFEKAEKLFQKKAWKSATAYYQKYREQNKKGKFYKSATLKIGLCFRHLKMQKEAKVFFRELVEFFPKSEEALLAQQILSQKKE